MRWLILMLMLCGPAFAQSIVLTEAFSDSAGELHFAVTKVLHVEGLWLKHPLEIGTIIEPPRVRRAYPLRRFGESVLFVLPQRENLRAYWSYNVHDGYVPGVEGRPLSEVVSMLVPTTNTPPAPSLTLPASRRIRSESRQPERDDPSENDRATHKFIIEALQVRTAPGESPSRVSSP